MLSNNNYCNRVLFCYLPDMVVGHGNIPLGTHQTNLSGRLSSQCKGKSPVIMQKHYPFVWWIVFLLYLFCFEHLRSDQSGHQLFWGISNTSNFFLLLIQHSHYFWYPNLSFNMSKELRKRCIILLSLTSKFKI